jgi:hypothetical protein
LCPLKTAEKQAFSMIVCVRMGRSGQTLAGVALGPARAYLCVRVFPEARVARGQDGSAVCMRGGA